jgi:Cof subfamily protein (haloacid dehalogenase superfamily)
MQEHDQKTIASKATSTQKVRLVAIDLDGTLLTDEKQISRRTANGIKEATVRGVKVVIASARPPRSVRHIYEALELDTYQINYNGALIWDKNNAKAIFHLPMEADLASQIVRYARGCFADVLMSCEILDRWYTDRMDMTYTTETGRLFRPDVVAPLEAFLNQPVTKLLLLGDSRTIHGLEYDLAGLYRDRVAMVRTDEHLLQFMHPRVSKAAALQKVADHYGVPMEQVMAIGDAPNDVGMLQLSGVAVAMDNADPRVKQVADWIAPSNNDHGVLAALRRYGLSE